MRIVKKILYLAQNVLIVNTYCECLVFFADTRWTSSSLRCRSKIVKELEQVFFKHVFIPDEYSFMEGVILGTIGLVLRSRHVI